MKACPPSYVSAKADGSLAGKVEELYRLLSPCRLCPRQCHVSRTQGEQGYCQSSADLVISSAFVHRGEEKPLVGTGGSGTIFMAGCSLRCVFCQNFEISIASEGSPASSETVADAMLALQDRGCHNINLVTPTHFVPQLTKALEEAARRGLILPIVYNCGGYESLDVLRLLDGIIDIYMPDIKFLDPLLSRRFCNASDYPDVVRDAVREMQRQVGDLVTDDSGVAVRGIIIRHLVMPSYPENTRAVIRFIRDEISKNAFVNIMAQYRPYYRAFDYPEISRPPTGEEYLSALAFAGEAGLTRAGRH